MGMNGHLGLNEPGTSFNLYSHIVELDETTGEVGKKYFSSGEFTYTRNIVGYQVYYGGRTGYPSA